MQGFEPLPLYTALADLGFEHLTEKVSDQEYRVYFHRLEKRGEGQAVEGEVPLKPTAMVNFRDIDPTLADIIVHFWQLIWGEENTAIEEKTKYLLSLANGVGAGRWRQATRELVKAYAAGVTLAELDELFALFVWNNEVGTFASGIGPSPLFGAYQLIKRLEKAGTNRGEVPQELVKKFEEKNPDVGTFYRGENGNG